MHLSLKYAFFKKIKFNPDVWYFKKNFYFLFQIYCSRRFTLFMEKVDWFVLCRKEVIVDAYQDTRTAGEVLRVGRGNPCLGPSLMTFEVIVKTSIQNSFSFPRSRHIPVSHFLVAPSFCSSVCYLYTILKLNDLYHSPVNYVRWDSNSISIYHVESALCISNTANTLLFQVDS